MNDTKTIWLDVDPGHDDATAIMLALNLSNIQLLGISTTHGNASSYHTAINAARCLLAFGGEQHQNSIRVYPGASKPLLLQPRHDPEIHGPDGLGGVEGLPTADDPDVLAMIAKDEHGVIIRALDGMSQHINRFWKNGSGKKVTIVSCGPMTNLALFVSVYPELLDAIEQFVFMGGGVGLGNRSAVAEFNILCDPHAAQIVLDAPVPAVMIPINVTHTAIVTSNIHQRLLSPNSDGATTSLRHTLSTLISFFADSYRSTFGFNDGPPLHDALTIAYVAHPELFNRSQRYRVDVELSGVHTIGETVVDVWDYGRYPQHDNEAESWGRNGKNCVVVQALDIDRFFEIFLECVARCDSRSSLNKGGLNHIRVGK